MQLQGKNAVVYGAAGAMGSAVARAFAQEGARVFLAGRTLAKLDRVAGEIRAAGGVAETAQVDAMDQTSVTAHADQVAVRQGASTSPSTPSASRWCRASRWSRCRSRTSWPR